MQKRTLWKNLGKARASMLGPTLGHGGLLRDILDGNLGKKRGLFPENRGGCVKAILQLFTL